MSLPIYLPEGDIEAIEKASVRVLDDAATCTWLVSRGFDPREVDALDAIRVLPSHDDCRHLPLWARRLRAWGYRIVFPLRDHMGVVRNFMFRHPRPAKGRAKSLPPKGYSTKGLVLSTGRPPHDTETVVICEGEPDWLTWALHGVHAIGVRSGAWTTGHAMSIASNATVALRTDCDPSGEKYAEGVRATLYTQTLLRLAGVEGDDNDRFQAKTLTGDPTADCVPWENPELPAQAPAAPQPRRRRVVCRGDSTPYGQAAIDAEVARLRVAKDGRKALCFAAARRLGQLVEGGEIASDNVVLSELLDATKLPANRARSHIVNGLARGHSDGPRTAPAGDDAPRSRSSRATSSSSCSATPSTTPDDAPRNIIQLADRRGAALPQVDPLAPLQWRTMREAERLRDKGALVVVRHSGFYDFGRDLLPAIQAGAKRVFIGGPMGCGKTTIVKSLVDYVARTGRPAVALVHRQSLAFDHARRLLLLCYQDKEGAIRLEEHAPGDDSERGWTVCLDSLQRVAWGASTRIGLVFIDEVEQLSRHLYGQTITSKSPGQSRKIFAVLQGLIRCADCVAVADADLGDAAYHLLRGSRAEPDRLEGELHLMHTGWTPRRIEAFERREHLVADLIEHLCDHPDDVVAVQCGSRRFAIYLKRLLAGETVRSLAAVPVELLERLRTCRPDLAEEGGDAMLLVIQKTRGDKRVEAFLADNTTEQGRAKVIISSPTLETGFSIDWPVSRVYGFFPHVFGKTCSDAFQHLWRYRQVDDGAFHVWLQARVDDLPCTPEEVDALGRAGSYRVELVDQMLDIHRAPGILERRPVDRDHWDFFLTVQAARNRGACDVRGGFLALCRERGYDVREIDAAEGEARHGDRHDWSAHIQEARDLERAHVAETAVQARAVTWDEAREKMTAKLMTPRERAEVLQARIAHTLGRDVEGCEVRVHADAPMQAPRITCDEVLEYEDGWGRSGRAFAYARHVVAAGLVRDDCQRNAWSPRYPRADERADIAGAAPGGDLCIGDEQAHCKRPRLGQRRINGGEDKAPGGKKEQGKKKKTRAKVVRCAPVPGDALRTKIARSLLTHRRASLWEERCGGGARYADEVIRLRALMVAGWRMDGCSRARPMFQTWDRRQAFIAHVRLHEAELSRIIRLEESWEEAPGRVLRSLLAGWGLTAVRWKRARQDLRRWRAFWIDERATQLARARVWSEATFLRLQGAPVPVHKPAPPVQVEAPGQACSRSSCEGGGGRQMASDRPETIEENVGSGPAVNKFSCIKNDPSGPGLESSTQSKQTTPSTLTFAPLGAATRSILGTCSAAGVVRIQPELPRVLEALSRTPRPPTWWALAQAIDAEACEDWLLAELGLPGEAHDELSERLWWWSKRVFNAERRAQ